MQPAPTSHQIDSARVLIRFVFRLVILLTFAGLAQTSYANAVSVLFTMSIALCITWGTIRHERILGPSLTNWDEAAAYACLALLAFKLAQ